MIFLKKKRLDLSCLGWKILLSIKFSKIQLFAILEWRIVWECVATLKRYGVAWFLIRFVVSDKIVLFSSTLFLQINPNILVIANEYDNTTNNIKKTNAASYFAQVTLQAFKKFHFFYSTHSTVIL